jgi:hypothetical protein
MALGIDFANSSILTELPPEIISKIGNLITILQAAGIIFIIYMTFLIIRWILTFKRYRKIKKMHFMMEEMDKKLDLLLKGKGHKVNISTKGLEKKVEKKKKERSKKH